MLRVVFAQCHEWNLALMTGNDYFVLLALEKPYLLSVKHSVSSFPEWC